MPTRRRTTIGLIKASLPRYFPEEHGVWHRVEACLGSLTEELGLRWLAADGIATNGEEASRAIDQCRAGGADFLLLVHGGFTMGDVGREIAAAELPLGVWTVPEPVRTGDVQLNNFVSLNMTMSTARLVRDMRRHPIRWYHGAPDSDALRHRLGTTLRAIDARAQVRGARIGRIGGLAPTFHNMESSSNLLRQRLGIEVVEHEMAELTGRMDSIDDTRVSEERARMEQAARVDGVSVPQMDLTVRSALGLRNLAADHGYDALAVSDWPALQEYPAMHPGGAFSWLEEVDALPCASEGDILGAVTQLLAKAVSGGRLGALLDMTEPDFDSGRLLMWHGGGGPLYMADQAGARWINHPMIGRGTDEGPTFGSIADFVFSPGRHTILRIGRDASAFFAMTVDVVAQDPSGFDGCRGWMEGFEFFGEQASLADVVNTVMAHGIEHHFIALPGDHADVLAEAAAWAGMSLLTMRRDRPHLRIEDFR